MISMPWPCWPLAPSNEMFGDTIRLAGLDLVTRLHIREGMPLCVSVIEMDRWGGDKRLPKCLEYLSRYGVHAKEVMPQLQQLRREIVKAERGRALSDKLQLIDKRLADIEASTKSPTVLDLQEFIVHAPTAQVR